jgi:hypothetical protein
MANRFAEKAFPAMHFSPKLNFILAKESPLTRVTQFPFTPATRPAILQIGLESNLAESSFRSTIRPGYIFIHADGP